MPWWIEQKVEGGGIGQELVNSVVESATRPPTQGTGVGQIELVSGPYPTKAAADAVAGIGQPSTGAPPSSSLTGPPNSGLGSILGLPTLSNLRNLVLRGAKVIAGMLLIAIGAVKLMHVDSAIPIIAKGAALA
jgi:hypothetical protein